MQKLTNYFAYVQILMYLCSIFRKKYCFYLINKTVMRRSYSKWSSIALIAAIYLFATVVGIVVYFAANRLSILDFTASAQPIIALLIADVVATIVVWAFGLLYENVSVYDPYWSVFPPVAFLLWAFYTGVWSLPVILRLPQANENADLIALQNYYKNCKCASFSNNFCNLFA
ncbi:MAG: hypothetical protein IJQ18_07785 [Paludibacteraceae bacterium]|nr:hypothetical protein [Paludibacteraceae bacterium]